MNQYSYETNKQLLQDLMRQVNISDIDELSSVAQVARLQLIRIQRGLILNLSVGTIAKIARALNISIDSLVETFVEQSPVNTKPPEHKNNDALTNYQQEYQKLQHEMLMQQEFLEAEFQKTSLETIESWLLQWPTAIAAVRNNPKLPAARLLPLVRPLEQLIKDWNLETIATVGETVAYDPQYHQLIKGTAQLGDLVQVRYVGYKQDQKLLYKAKVSPVET